MADKVVGGGERNVVIEKEKFDGQELASEECDRFKLVVPSSKGIMFW